MLLRLAVDQVNVIRLSGRFGILITDDRGYSLSASEILSGTWRIVRCDDWQHDERVVSALRLLGAHPDVELVDPTGLLGGSQYGVERRSLHTEPAPFGKSAAGAARRAAVKAPRRSASGDGNDRAWR